MSVDEYTREASQWQNEPGIKDLLRDFSAQGKILSHDFNFHSQHLQWTVEYADRAAFEECLPKFAAQYREQTRIAHGFRAKLTVVQNGKIIFQKGDPA